VKPGRLPCRKCSGPIFSASLLRRDSGLTTCALCRALFRILCYWHRLSVDSTSTALLVPPPLAWVTVHIEVNGLRDLGPPGDSTLLASSSAGSGTWFAMNELRVDFSPFGGGEPEYAPFFHTGCPGPPRVPLPAPQGPGLLSAAQPPRLPTRSSGHPFGCAPCHTSRTPLS